MITAEQKHKLDFLLTEVVVAELRSQECERIKKAKYAAMEAYLSELQKPDNKIPQSETFRQDQYKPTTIGLGGRG